MMSINEEEFLNPKNRIIQNELYRMIDEACKKEKQNYALKNQKC